MKKYNKPTLEIVKLTLNVLSVSNEGYFLGQEIGEEWKSEWGL